MRPSPTAPRSPTMGRRCFVETFGPHFPADDMALHLERMFGPGRASPPSSPTPRLRVRMAEEDGEIAAYLKLAPMSLPVAARAGRARDQAALRARALAGRRRRGRADGLGGRDRAGRGRAGPLSQRLGAWRPRHRFLCAGTASRRSATRPSCSARRDLSGPGDEARPVTVEVIRAAALAGLPHGFLGRRGGVSTGVCAGLNVGLGSDDDRAAIAENRRRAVEAVAPGAALVTVHQVHSPDARLRRRALARRRPPPCRRDRHRPARPRARHPHRRLHAGPARRPRGRRDRRRPCRLEGRVRRRDRSDGRGDGGARRRPRAGSPPRSAR